MTDEKLDMYEKMVREAQIKADEEKVKVMQQDNYIANNERSMIAEQLDLGEELERIDYLLRGYILEIDPETKQSSWVKPEDNEMIILSDYGVHLIRNTIAWYMNKNTLLSNYDEETILHKMEDFASDLNDTIFMEYEKIFQYPTFEECKDILKERLEKKINLRIFTNELLERKVSDADKEKIRKKVYDDIEPIIEKELTKIKEQIIKNKLKRFMIIIREVQDAVHSTYLRAWKGQERATLRQHTHISENRGSPMMQDQRGILDKLRGK